MNKYVKYSIVTVSVITLYYEIKSLYGLYNYYNYVKKIKKSSIKKIKKIINNFNINNINKENFKINNDLVSFKAFFDAEVSNIDINNNIISHITKKNNISYKYIMHNVNWTDPKDNNFIIKNINLYNENIINDYTKLHIETEFESNFDYYNLILNSLYSLLGFYNLNNTIEITNKKLSIFSNSKLFIFAEFIFSIKNKKLEDIRLIEIFKNKYDFFFDMDKFFSLSHIKISFLLLILYYLTRDEIKYYTIKIIKKWKNILKTNREDLQCIICFDNMRDIILSPCNHLMMCSICYYLLDKSKQVNCIICKKNVDEVIFWEKF